VFKCRVMNDHRKRDHEPGGGTDEARYKKHLDKITLRVTVASVIVAVLAVGAAFWSAGEAHWARVDDERPMLRAEPINKIDKVPLRAIIETHIWAEFKTPAKNVRVTCITANDVPAGSVRWNPSWEITNTIPIIFPEVWAKAACPLQPHFDATPGTPVVQFGTIQYQDLKNAEYLTPFCFYYRIIPPDAPGDQAPDVSICPDFRGLPDLQH
jgi:hypothetical protein